MQGITGWRDEQVGYGVVHALVVLSVVGLALLGQLPEEAAGWRVWPGVAYSAGWLRRSARGVPWRANSAFASYS